MAIPYKAVKKFKILQVNKAGHSSTVYLRPGVPVELFDKKGDADDWALNNPDKITTTPKAYYVQSITTLEQIKEVEEKEKAAASKD